MPSSETWGHSTVRTACPLDCPDSCTLDVTVEKGRVVKIDGGDDNPVTRDFICGKVRRFAERVYGEDRLLYPAVRQGAKGQGTFVRVTWDEALDLIAQRMTDIRGSQGRRSDPALLLRRLERSAHAGHQRRDAVPRASAPHGWPARSAPRRPARPTWRSTARWPASPIRTIPHARLIVSVGRQPGRVGHPPRPVPQRSAESRGATGRRRSADHVAGEAGRPAPRGASRHRPAGRARAASLPVRGRPRRSRLSRRAHDRRRPAAGAGREWTFERAAGVAGIEAARAAPLRRALRRILAGAGPLRLGPRAQSQRRRRGGGGPGAAGGRRQVRRPRRRLLDEQLHGARASRPRPG